MTRFVRIHAEPLLLDHYFKQTSSPLVYERIVQESSQCLSFDPQPLSSSKKHFSCQEFISISMPGVNEIAKTMISDHKWLGDPEITIWQPAQLLLPWGNRALVGLSSECEVESYVRRFCINFQTYFIGFMDDYQSPLDLISQHEMGDDRPLKQRYWWIYLAASYAFVGKPEAGYELLDKKFGASSKRIFASAFEFLRKAMSRQH